MSNELHNMARRIEAQLERLRKEQRELRDQARAAYQAKVKAEEDHSTLIWQAQDRDRRIELLEAVLLIANGGSVEPVTETTDGRGVT